jgi:hypothetical protein
VPANEVKRVVHSARSQLKTAGVGGFVRTAVDFAWSPIAYAFSPLRKEPGTFELGGETFTYERRLYPNRPWRNERSVEIALALDFVRRRAATRMLEVGDVLSQYEAHEHDIVDKYDPSPGIIREDIVDFHPEAPYESIISISTLEHVGWDETPRQPEKALAAYRNMRSMLAPGGAMLLTCPLGHNARLDEQLHEGALDFPIQRFMLRVSADNRWREASKDEVRGARYNHPYRNANAIFVGRIEPLGTAQASTGQSAS